MADQSARKQNLVKLDRESILKEITNSKDIEDALYRLYKAVIPDFDYAQRIEGYPEVNLNTAKEIIHVMYEKFPHQISKISLLWLQKGFGQNEDLKDWEVDTSNVTLHFGNNFEPSL